MKVRSLMVYALLAMLTAVFMSITPVWANDNTDNQATSSTMIDQNQDNSSANSHPDNSSNNSMGNNDQSNGQNNEQTTDQTTTDNATPDTATGGDDDY